MKSRLPMPGDTQHNLNLHDTQQFAASPPKSASSDTDPRAKDERISALEQIIEAKTQEIRTLQAQLQEFRSARAAPKEAELHAMFDELDHQRAALANERRALEAAQQRMVTEMAEVREDMKQMEISMSHERAQFHQQLAEVQGRDEAQREASHHSKNAVLNAMTERLRAMRGHTSTGS